MSDKEVVVRMREAARSERQSPLTPERDLGELSPSPSTNGFAVASLVLGILWLWWVGSTLALVFGYVGKSQIDRSPETQSGRGLALAGIVLGWVGVGILALLLILFLVGVFTMPWGPMMRDRG